ncbi:hypothetical protein [Serratia symbiotica]|uniref:hypothetical protein n=1 Tax=Serratia symbiotica TaxID=138074 RepID=UPI001E6468CC|nr:hypothetical protein [Serratia symbiotica]
MNKLFQKKPQALPGDIERGNFPINWGYFIMAIDEIFKNRLGCGPCRAARIPPFMEFFFQELQRNHRGIINVNNHRYFLWLSSAYAHYSLKPPPCR